MPKMKSKSSAKKRFRVTGSGRIKHAHAFHNHNLEHKSAKRGRRLRQTSMVNACEEHRVKRMLLLA